jgi:uncharacterized membrane protein
MKARLITALWFGLITTVPMVLSAYSRTIEGTDRNQLKVSKATEPLKQEAFKILDAKCNVCHRKQNPFMVFKEKNMSKRASKIYQMVFVERRMPKGEEIQLTKSEYNTLEQWLKTEKTF